MLILAALPLLFASIGTRLNTLLSRLVGGIPGSTATGSSVGAQFGIGMLLGLVWLPCVGPTLGAAIALASLGQQMLKAFVVMLVFGAGTAAVLVAAGLLSASALRHWKPALMQGAGRGKLWLGATLLLLGLLVLTGIDKWLEAWAVGWLPDWAVSI
jgi:cytochrome c-type biogenesis protein